MSGVSGIGVRSGLVGREEEADGPVAGGQVLRGDLLDLRGRDLLDAVAIEEVEPPVALRGPLAQLDGDAIGIGRGQLAILEDRLPGAVDFLLRDAGSAPPRRRPRSIVSRTFSSAAQVLGVDLGHRSRSCPGRGSALADGRDARGLLGLDQGLVEPARRLGAEDLGQDLDRRELGVRGGRDVIEQRRPGRRRPPGAA